MAELVPGVCGNTKLTNQVDLTLLRLLKVFRGPGVARQIRALHRSGMLEGLLPHLTQMEQISFGGGETKGNLLAHVFDVVKYVETIFCGDFAVFNSGQEEKIALQILQNYQRVTKYWAGPLFRENLFLAALLHDIGILPDGERSNHAKKGIKPAENILRELGIPLARHQEICWLIKHHDLLGPVYLGERSPRLFYGLPPHQRIIRLRALVLFTLCDVRGTNPRVLKNSKAEFYLKYSRDLLRLDDPSKFYEFRLQGLAGLRGENPLPERFEEIKKLLAQLPQEEQALLSQHLQNLDLDYGYPTLSRVAEADNGAENFVKLLLAVILMVEKEVRKGRNIEMVSFKWGWPAHNAPRLSESLAEINLSNLRVSNRDLLPSLIEPRFSVNIADKMIVVDHK